MDSIVPSRISLLLEKIEALYNITLVLTEESEATETEIDRRIAIEEIRKETLQKADLLFEEIAQWLSGLSDGNEVDEWVEGQHFLNQKERLLQLVYQICQMDKKKAALIHEEQTTLFSALQSFRLSKQAVMQYQKAIPTEI